MNVFKYFSFIKNGLIGGKDIITDRAGSVFDIDYEKFEKTHKLIIFDFDDTLAQYWGELPANSKELLQRLQESGFKIGIFSNCPKWRDKELDEMLKPLGVYNVNKSNKPKPDGFIEAMKHYDIKPEETMVIGDKLGSEMYGAYLAGASVRILVEPFTDKFGGRGAKFLERLVRNWERNVYYSKKNSSL